MNVKCDVIRDLLPLYMDGLVSEETKALVDEHLEHCEDCRKYLAEMKDAEEMPRQEFVEEMKPLKKIKRKAMLNRIALVVVALALVAFGAFIIKHETEPCSDDLGAHASWTVPKGYELVDGEEGDDYRTYVRDTDGKRERLDINYDSARTLVSSSNEEISVGNGWQGQMHLADWDHSSSNGIEGVLTRDGNGIRVSYSCRIIGEDNYYDSCSNEQKEEFVEFLRTFEYKELPKAEGNIFERFWKEWGVLGLFTFLPALLIIIGMPLAAVIGSLMGRDEKIDKKRESVNSMELHAEMNEERKRQGDPSLPAINTVGGVSTNNLARKDKSWSSVPDFFLKLIRRK